ncbi:YAP-binding/ALF4/Glomulin [Tricharina praecox]|uniref:YAP-binding/ALF4/Glomulin n=1 Tax=Tricharina praecox TaxID=43433 RepID=UPI00221F2E95|nr:YAP-binding/ALF4/Glomulin [Tricharina praecox]KAI5843765.1 YAP-binding/ALF4/Glomulin [Tricharina praecox]
MSREEITLSKAIASIRSAADELSVDEFIDFSVILDVHIHWSLESLSPEDQHQFLSVLKEVLEAHEELSCSIAWDLVIVLLPYLDSPLPKTVDIAEQLIAYSATIGNPREVYIKVLTGLSSLSWSPAEEEDDEDEDQDEAEHSGDEEDDIVPKRELQKKEDPMLYAQNAARKFNNLLSALTTVHPRIAARFPSKFLSTELSTLLIAFTKAVEVVDAEAVTGVVQRLLQFLKGVRPQLKETATATKRPPLPPRVSTSASLQTVNPEAKEDQLQARLIASFLTHVLSGYLLRTKRQHHPQQQSTSEDHHSPDVQQLHPAFRGGFDDVEERGLDIGWAGKYDEEVLRPDKFKVPNGRTLIDEERDARAAQGNVRAAVDEIVAMCESLGVKTEELVDLCRSGADGLTDDEEDDHSEIPAPKAADDVPLSKHGALFLLTHRLSTDPHTTHLQIYPDHSTIAETFMIYAPGQSKPAVIDSILFLGLYILHTSQSLGDLPEKTETFFIYLQIFSVISTNASSASHRYLANTHVALCLRAHPSEAVRLAYFRDTLEHCPFESVKGAVVGMLKDEIVHATTPVLRDGASVPSTPNSIFGTSLCLSEIFAQLFPDLEIALGDDDAKAWEKFRDLYPRFAATINLYLLLLLNHELAARLGAANKAFGDKVETRFLAPVRKRLDRFIERERTEGDRHGVNVQLVEMTMQRVQEARGGIVD